MPTVAWLPEALEDFLAEKNLQAARNAIGCIQAAANILEQHPEAGKPMDDDTGRREIFAAFGAGAYVLRYRLNTQGDPVIIREWRSREARM